MTSTVRWPVIPVLNLSTLQWALLISLTLHGALLKNEQDVHLFERLVFMSRQNR